MGNCSMSCIMRKRQIAYAPTKTQIKIKLRSYKSSEPIYEKGDEPYRGFGYSSLFSDPLDLATLRQCPKGNTVILQLSTG